MRAIRVGVKAACVRPRRPMLIAAPTRWPRSIDSSRPQALHWSRRTPRTPAAGCRTGAAAAGLRRRSAVAQVGAAIDQSHLVGRSAGILHALSAVAYPRGGGAPASTAAASSRWRCLQRTRDESDRDCRCAEAHTFSKPVVPTIMLARAGVEDAHQG